MYSSWVEAVDRWWPFRCLVVCVLVLAASCVASPPSEPKKQPVNAKPVAQRMLQYENALRKRHGLPARVMSPELVRAAQRYAEFMANSGRFGHFLDDDPWKRARREGYRYSSLTENIAKGYVSVDMVYGGWKTSPGHWKAILDRHQDAGYGHAVSRDGDDYWVAMYGTRKK